MSISAFGSDPGQETSRGNGTWKPGRDGAQWSSQDGWLEQIIQTHLYHTFPYNPPNQKQHMHWFKGSKWRGVHLGFIVNIWSIPANTFVGSIRTDDTNIYNLVWLIIINAVSQGITNIGNKSTEIPQALFWRQKLMNIVKVKNLFPEGELKEVGDSMRVIVTGWGRDALLLLIPGKFIDHWQVLSNKKPKKKNRGDMTYPIKDELQSSTSRWHLFQQYFAADYKLQKINSSLIRFLQLKASTFSFFISWWLSQLRTLGTPSN